MGTEASALQLPADYMSHHPILSQTGVSTLAAKEAKEYVNFIASHATSKP